jgi:hypothetical protein
MKGILVLILTVIVAAELPAQRIIVKNKADFYLYLGTNLPTGPLDYGTGKPALISNMGASTSLDLQYVQSIWKGLYLGGVIRKSNFSSWSYSAGLTGATTYAGTTVQILSASPVFMLKSQTQEIKEFRKLSCFISIVPGFHRIDTKTSQSSGINSNDPSIPLTVQSTRFGVGGNAGVDYVFSSSIGLSVTFGYQQIATKSQVYQESSFSFVTLKAGLFYRMFKDKKYRYSNL